MSASDTPSPEETPEPTAADVVVQAVGLKKKYGRVQALAGVSLEVRQGENLCVIGPNGAGKTTLLYLLGGMIFPSAGHVTVFGRHRWKENFEIRKHSAILTTEPLYGESPTPYEYLRFLAQIYGLPKQTFRDKVRRLVDEMQYAPHINRAWGRLSLGLAKKAGLIACFLVDVPLRILDEPFAGGIDPIGMEVLYGWMTAARERGETTVFSTQVLDQAEDVADRLVMLQEGRILAEGSPSELIAKAGVAATDERALAKAFLKLTQQR